MGSNELYQVGSELEYIWVERGLNWMIGLNGSPKPVNTLVIAKKCDVCSFSPTTFKGFLKKNINSRVIS